MIDFAHSFLLIFAQLAFGGLFGLSIPGFHEIERGFFKSTGCVYLGCGWVFFVGKTYLVVSAQAEAVAGLRGWEIGLWLGVLLRLQRVCRQPVGRGRGAARADLSVRPGGRPGGPGGKRQRLFERAFGVD